MSLGFQSVRSDGTANGIAVSPGCAATRPVSGPGFCLGWVSMLNETNEKGSVFMRSMCKGLFVALVAVLALGSVSSAAMGAEWSVNGSTAFGTEALSGATNYATGLRMTGEGYEITCATLKLEGGEIFEGGNGSATAVVLGKCKELWNSSKCKLSSPTITTGAVTIDVVNATEVEIAPKPPATILATYGIEEQEGQECGLVGIYTLTGDAVVTVADASTEATEHLATFNSKSKIKRNGSAITLDGSSPLELASGKDWSIQ